MKKDARQGDFGWHCFDLDAGAAVPLCIWADDETGEYEHYVPGPNGKPQIDPADRTRVLKRRGQGRIILVPPGADMPVVVRA